jgi:hypothetical protein
MCHATRPLNLVKLYRPARNLFNTTPNDPEACHLPYSRHRERIAELKMGLLSACRRMYKWAAGRPVHYPTAAYNCLFDLIPISTAQI